MAGPAAEYALTRRIVDNCDIDLADAERHLRVTGLRLDDLWPKALSLVDRHGPEIQAVARELLWRGRLSGIEIEVLIGGGWTAPGWA